MADIKAGAADQRTGFAAFLAHPYLLLTLAPLFWGGNMVAAKLAVGVVPPYVLLFARFVAAALLVAPFSLPHLKRDWLALSRRRGAGCCFTGLSASPPSTPASMLPPTIPLPSIPRSSRHRSRSSC